MRFQKQKMKRQEPRSNACKVDGCGKPRKEAHRLCAKHWEKRRAEYQREYYLAHEEDAKLYQRQYNLTYKKKQKRDYAKSTVARPKVRCFKPMDIQALSPEKIIRNWSRLV